MSQLLFEENKHDDRHPSGKGRSTTELRPGSKRGRLQLRDADE